MNIEGIRIGPSGNDEEFFKAGYKRGYETPMFINSIGLNAFEYSFGRGFNCSLETSSVVGQYAKQHDVLYSVHAPFYINFANTSDDMIKKSINYVTKSIEYLYTFGGKHVVFHPASQGTLSRETAVSAMTSNIKKLVEEVYRLGYDDVYICPETMGKSMQVGTYREVVDLCMVDKILVPCFDFGHINALGGGSLKSAKDFKAVFDYCHAQLGDYKTKNCHIHFSKIQYGDKGEIKHLNFDDNVYGPEFEPLAKVIKDLKLSPTIICESTSKMSSDALYMKKILQNV